MDATCVTSTSIIIKANNKEFKTSAKFPVINIPMS